MLVEGALEGELDDHLGYARHDPAGLTYGEIYAHLAEVYGAEVSKQTITTITDRVMEGVAEWQGRPLDPAWLCGGVH
jgi:transposase-like protein